MNAAVYTGGTMSITVGEVATYAGENNWYVQDNGSLEVVYPVWSEEALDTGSGAWTLVDKNGHYVVYEWNSKFSSVGVEGHDPHAEYSPYIEHDGVTDLMDLNSPAHGDIDICGPAF